MLNSNGVRELAYVVLVDGLEPIPGYDRVEHAIVGGWRVIVQKDKFKVGEPAIYFEIDSRVPSNMECFAFLEKRNYKVKTLKMCHTLSQGLLMHAEDFGWHIAPALHVEGYNTSYIVDNEGHNHNIENESRFLTKQLGITYADEEDNQRKAAPVDKYKKMASRHPNLFKKPIVRWIMKHKFGRKIMFFFFGHKKDKATGFPTKFPFVKKTDQERCENIPNILQDKTPYIRTEKCDGSSGTFILERLKRKNKFEFYVCSRNVRMLKPTQECFYGNDNYYWEVAIKYDIENKLKDYLIKHPELSYVCWQGEICAPKIQSNAHHLKNTHLYLFHMIDSIKGRYDIRDAKTIWESYNMEHVPIDDNLYVFPDNFEEFKLSADGYYNSSVCEGNAQIAREGYVYYKSTDPNFSFKNVSRIYLLKNSK